VRGVLRAGGIAEFDAAVQVKRYKKNVQAPTVCELRGWLVVHEQGIIITTSAFSKGAQAEAVEPGKTRISLIGCEQLLELLIQYGIGVTEELHTVLALDEEWWGEVAGPGHRCRRLRHRQAPARRRSRSRCPCRRPCMGRRSRRSCSTLAGGCATRE
jgi:hypothetical protein